jgi:hypothetical protein
MLSRGLEVSRRAGYDPAGDVRRHEELDRLDFFAMTNLESLIRPTRRDYPDDRVGSGVPAWAGRKVLENEGLAGDDEDLPPVRANVDDERYDQKCRKHSEDDEERPVARHMLKSVAHVTSGISGERSESAACRGWAARLKREERPEMATTVNREGTSVRLCAAGALERPAPGETASVQPRRKWVPRKEPMEPTTAPAGGVRRYAWAGKERGERTKDARRR